MLRCRSILVSISMMVLMKVSSAGNSSSNVNLTPLLKDIWLDERGWYQVDYDSNGTAVITL